MGAQPAPPANMAPHAALGLPACLPHTQAYLAVAPHVAGFPGYLEPLARHLLGSKLRHWDKGLRELAAQALAGGHTRGCASFGCWKGGPTVRLCRGRAAGACAKSGLSASRSGWIRIRALMRPGR